MSDARQERGRQAEDLAADWLRRRGHRILARNLRLRVGEVDLVTEDRGTIVFVEVRSRSGHMFGTGLESVDRRKRRRIRVVAESWIALQHLDDHAIRFDVIGVEWRSEGPTVEHIEDAFDADDT